MKAILPDKSEIPPTNIGTFFHGTLLYVPEDVFKNGIPRKGTDRRLYEHSRGNPDSAFRGATTHYNISNNGQGAAYWAGENGWVYELANCQAWDLNQSLEGRVPTPWGLFSGVLTIGELEYAIAAQIPSGQIVRASQVTAGRLVRSGAVRVILRNWQDNPNR